jgi:WD40 repeat protein
MDLLFTADLGSPVSRVRFHPRGRLLVATSASRNEVHCWHWQTAGRFDYVGMFGVYAALPVLGANFHPGGEYLAVASHNFPLQLWQLCSGPDGEPRPRPLLARLVGLPAESVYLNSSVFPSGVVQGPVRNTALPASFKSIAFDQSGAVMFAADEAVPGSRVLSFPVGDAVASFWSTEGEMACHPSEPVLATAKSDGFRYLIRFLRAAAPFNEVGAPQDTRLERVGRLTFSPDGSLLAAVGGLTEFELEVFEYPAMRVRCERVLETSVPVPPGVGLSSELEYFLDCGATFAERAVFSPRGDRLICPYPTGELAEIDTATGRDVRRWQAHRDYILTLDHRADLGLLVSGGNDRQVKVWATDYTGARGRKRRDVQGSRS